MKNSVRLSPSERAATALLEAKGYAVVPLRPCFPTHHKPAHLMARRTVSEQLYLKQTARPLTVIPATETFCLSDARLLFPLGSKTTTLQPCTAMSCTTEMPIAFGCRVARVAL